jgi:hypothetical protein
MRFHRLSAASAAALAAVVFAACGEDEQTSSASPSGPQADGPVPTTDETGRRVELEAPAERVVTAEWDHTENALALGVTPVGAGALGLRGAVKLRRRPTGSTARSYVTAEVRSRIRCEGRRALYRPRRLLTGGQPVVRRSSGRSARISPVEHRQAVVNDPRPVEYDGFTDGYRESRDQWRSSRSARA